MDPRGRAVESIGETVVTIESTRTACWMERRSAGHWCLLVREIVERW